ncbi:MAG: winged helix-turn-helix transcriptional regulator [Microbacteriaceae bacterium]|nr:winged helix-turn-helix transcriptional regulator [Cryobacterium sp.]MCC6376462.1 winged helix-turn-helix transcriptional regulator [Microbacteriaceae bacterium]
MAAREYGQFDGIATAVELIGERWALLIVRDLLVGPRRYSDLKLGLPKIPTNVLSARLKELQSSGIIERIPLHHGLAYRLTSFGQQLEDAVLSLGRWGFQALGEPKPGEIITPDSMAMTFRTAFQPAIARLLPATTYDAQITDFGLRLQVYSDQLEVEPFESVSKRQSEFDSPYVSFVTDTDIHKLIAGELSATNALSSRSIKILSGDQSLLQRFAQTFHLEAA